MHLIVSILVIIFVFACIAVLWVYNQLILLQVNKDNTLNDIAQDLDALIWMCSWPTYKKAISHRDKATTPVEKIHAFNCLWPAIEDLARTDANVYLEKTCKQRRYYNHTTKKLNALLDVFPSNMVGNMLWYTKEPTFILTWDEKRGETPQVKR